MRPQPPSLATQLSHSMRFVRAGSQRFESAGSRADSAGYAGLEDDVVIGGIFSTENTVNQTGQTLVSRQLNVQPTLTIRPGFPVRVVVNRNLVFVPYKG